jgi:hypothetical protein
MLTVFGNLLINSEKKLQYLKDSFLSFNTISDNWLINVRGEYRDQAIDFLTKNLDDKIELFELLDDRRGWSKNALEMLEKAKNDYILIWIEDHINLAPQDIYKEIVKELNQDKVDHLLYSWWLDGHVRKKYDKIGFKQFNYIDTIEITSNNWNNNGDLVSLISIVHKDFFRKLLEEDVRKWPRLFGRIVHKLIYLPNYIGFKIPDVKYFEYVNHHIFKNKLPKFPKETPFNIEKEPYRIDLLPMKIAFPKRELFACIDDDFLTEGYSLQSRGLYKIDPDNKRLFKNA